jgi:hypothetical protein
MNKLEKECYIGIFRERYRRAKKKSRGKILDEVTGRLEVGRRQARRLLNRRQVGRPGNPERRGRPGKYQDREFIGELRFVWKKTRYMCSRHLKAAMPTWLPFIEKDGRRFRDDIRVRLLSISAPTIDRLLKPYKALKGLPLTRSGGFREEIPIQENIWDEKRPGFLEADTVGHCGGSTMGEYLNSLTMVDIATTWTETRTVFSKASGPIVKAIEDIEDVLPFDIRGYDSDNGTEVLNRHVLRYFREERVDRNRTPVQITRSREYRKNDNAHVEQRNNSVPRRWLGYERMDFAQLAPLVNHYFRDIICPLMNHFFPSFKLANKIRVKSRIRRVYNDPITPYTRVMESPFVSNEQKERLKRIHDSLNPIVLLKREETLRRQIDTTLKELRAGQFNTLGQKTPNPVTEIRISDPPKLPLRKSAHNFRGHDL